MVKEVTSEKQGYRLLWKNTCNQYKTASVTSYGRRQKDNNTAATYYPGHHILQLYKILVQV